MTSFCNATYEDDPGCMCACYTCFNEAPEYPVGAPDWPGPNYLAIPINLGANTCPGSGTWECDCGHPQWGFHSALPGRGWNVNYLAIGPKLGRCCGYDPATGSLLWSWKQTEYCCNNFGQPPLPDCTGTPRPILSPIPITSWNPDPNASCSGLPSCCGCDWCCDRVSSGDCTTKRIYSWENLPAPKTTPCSGNSCSDGPHRPDCRRAEFALGKRPAAHEPPERGGTDHIGKHEMHSANRIRAMDRAPGTEECRTYYGHVANGAPLSPTTRKVGWLCGHANRRDTATGALNGKTAHRCYPNKRPDGRHSFECAYRPSCPEKPSVCL